MMSLDPLNRQGRMEALRFREGAGSHIEVASLPGSGCQRAPSAAASGAEDITPIGPPKLRERCVRPREQAVGTRIIGIDVDGLFQKSSGNLDLLRGTPVPNVWH